MQFFLRSTLGSINLFEKVDPDLCVIMQMMRCYVSVTFVNSEYSCLISCLVTSLLPNRCSFHLPLPFLTAHLLNVGVQASPCLMARYGQRARVRAVNRPKSEDFRENPPLIRRRWAFFSYGRRTQQTTLRVEIMTILEALNREEKFVALTHLYLEFPLSLEAAMDAAAADLLHLENTKPVAEAA
jgi:hypothetical protein